MIRFVRASGGALGAILAIALAGGSQDFFDPSAWGRLVLSGWIVAWAVLGYSIMPYITVQPAQRMVRGAMALSSGDFVAGILGLLVGLVISVLLGCRWRTRLSRGPGSCPSASRSYSGWA